MIFRGNRAGIVQKFTLDVDPEIKGIQGFLGGFQWYMMEQKGFISSTRFILKIEIENIVYFKGQNNNFRLSTRKNMLFFIVIICPRQ